MNERMYLRLKKQIEDEARRKLEALNTIWEMARTTAKRSDRLPGNGMMAKGALIKAVRQALPAVRGNFTVKNIKEHLESDHPELVPLKRASLSSVLKRLEEAGEVQLVHRGKGKAATLYSVR